jgi:signal transduction histidine kinase
MAGKYRPNASPSEPREEHMQIGELLDRKGHQIYAVGPDWTVRKAAALIAERNIGATIVTDAAGHLVGIISERDLVRALNEFEGNLLDCRVSGVMTASVVTCAPETSVGDALSLMASHRIRHLPVVREDAVLGLISIRDVLEFRLESLEANFAAVLRGKREAALAYRAAERAERETAAFVAGLGNKLTPALHAILDAAGSLAAGSSDGSDLRDYLSELQAIDANGRAALDTVDNAVALTQLNSHEREPAGERVVLPELIAAAATAVREAALQKGVTIAVAADRATPALVADRRMVKQMLHELLDNAVKFTPAGGTVAVGCEAEHDGGVRATVGDAGIGMTPEQIAKAAQPFQRAAGLTTRSDGGFGLALVDAIMRAHHGTLVIDSRVGIGTTATLHFPPAAAMVNQAEAAD